MPEVDGKHYPYTKKGKADAAKAGDMASRDARDRTKEFRAGSGAKPQPEGPYFKTPKPQPEGPYKPRPEGPPQSALDKRNPLKEKPKELEEKKKIGKAKDKKLQSAYIAHKGG